MLELISWNGTNSSSTNYYIKLNNQIPIITLILIRSARAKANPGTQTSHGQKLCRNTIQIARKYKVTELLCNSQSATCVTRKGNDTLHQHAVELTLIDLALDDAHVSTY